MAKSLVLEALINVPATCVHTDALVGILEVAIEIEIGIVIGKGLDLETKRWMGSD